VISTTSYDNTKITINFNDGNIRHVFKNSVYSITNTQTPTKYEGITGTIRALFNDNAATHNYDNIIGTRINSVTGYKIHSDVIFQFENGIQKVSVIEGEVEVFNLNTGEYVGSVYTGEQYILSDGVNPSEGTIGNSDFEEYSGYLDDGCCLGLIFLPLLVLLVYLKS